MAVKFLDETFTHEGRQWRRITAEADERWVLSVDLGQAADFTAISLLHHRRSPLETFAEIRHPNGRGSLKQNVEEVIDVRHLERLKLHTPYPDQVAYVAELLARPPLNQTGCDLIIDDEPVVQWVHSRLRLGFGEGATTMRKSKYNVVSASRLGRACRRFDGDGS